MSGMIVTHDLHIAHQPPHSDWYPLATREASCLCDACGSVDVTVYGIDGSDGEYPPIRLCSSCLAGMARLLA